MQIVLCESSSLRWLIVVTFSPLWMDSIWERNDTCNKTVRSLKSFADYSQYALALQSNIYTDFGCGWNSGSVAAFAVTAIYHKHGTVLEVVFFQMDKNAIKNSLNGTFHSSSALYTASRLAHQVSYLWKLIKKKKNTSVIMTDENFIFILHLF